MSSPSWSERQEEGCKKEDEWRRVLVMGEAAATCYCGVQFSEARTVSMTVVVAGELRALCGV